MFTINTKRISPGTAFEHEGILYPSNWIQYATTAERTKIGLVETPDPLPVDSRFYFVSGGGPAVERPIGQIIAMHIASIKAEASVIILTKYPLWRQINRLAIPSVAAEINLIRKHSDVLEAEVAQSSFVQLIGWKSHDWPKI